MSQNTPKASADPIISDSRVGPVNVGTEIFSIREVIPWIARNHQALLKRFERSLGYDSLSAEDREALEKIAGPVQDITTLTPRPEPFVVTRVRELASRQLMVSIDRNGRSAGQVLMSTISKDYIKSIDEEIRNMHEKWRPRVERGLRIRRERAESERADKISDARMFLSKHDRAPHSTQMARLENSSYGQKFEHSMALVKQKKADPLDARKQAAQDVLASLESLPQSTQTKLLADARIKSAHSHVLSMVGETKKTRERKKPAVPKLSVPEQYAALCSKLDAGHPDRVAFKNKHSKELFAAAGMVG